MQDNELWEDIENKLVDERLYRYLDVVQLCDVVGAFANVGRGSDELLDLIENYVIKHRKALTDDAADTAKWAF